MRRAVLGLVAIPALGALAPACGGAVSHVVPEEHDSGSPIAQVDATAPPETDASVTIDASSHVDASSAPDAPADTAPTAPDAGLSSCTMQLDPTFGVGGISTSVNPRYSWASAIAFDPSGRMLVSMWDAAYAQDYQVAIVRFDAAGAVDPTYGDGGFAPLAPPSMPPHDAVSAGQLVVQPDGKSLVVGWNPNTPAMGRFNADGTIDTTFGSSGSGPGGGYAMPTTDWPNWWQTLTLLGDGSILVGGSADFNTGGLTLLLAKYDQHGLVDSTFGAGGQLSVLSTGGASQLLARPDGSFLVGGTANPRWTSVADMQPSVQRYTAAGALDIAFGSGGTATAPMTAGSGPVVGMATQSTGAIVVAVAMAGSPNGDFLLLRYTPGGQLDPTFGVGGVARTDFFGAIDYAVGLSVLPDDSLLVAGTVNEPTDASQVVDFGIARYTADGQPDSTFAPGGKLVTHFPQGGVNEVDAQGLQADGKLVVAGYGTRVTDAGEEYILTLARYACR
jgi:uncharacterized delta-60 repeat protein